ncbi:DUF624 domain-containing protein [Vibrio quintilis]|uniref:DUF624 domain-containing protein n=1 Tax=Vibrio quintilis TaxID=1117707 RepID=UPI0021C5CD95|nr:DUF624 domain-containing protein [Vibrio quintilis]
MEVSPLITACHWITRLAWLNITWLVFSILGCGIFGILPATVMVCLMIRRYLNGTARVTIKEMWSVYIQEFIRCNKTGWLVLLPAFSLLWYVRWGVLHLNDKFVVVVLCCIPLIILAFVVVFCALIQMSIYDTNSVKDNLKNALVLLIEDKWILSASLITLIVCMLLVLLSPVIAIFFSISPVLFSTVGLLWLKKDELKLHVGML